MSSNCYSLDTPFCVFAVYVPGLELSIIDENYYSTLEEAQLSYSKYCNTGNIRAYLMYIAPEDKEPCIA